MQGNDIGLIGLAVMGQNLARNMADKGYRVSVYNRSERKTEAFMAGPGSKAGITAAFELTEFVRSLACPRKILLMVRAGKPVDAVIEQLLPLLGPGDLIMDGGNSHWTDTERRSRELEARGFHYLGIGVSGGEEGALLGPSIMPGGSAEAYRMVEPLLETIAGRAEGQPCVSLMGRGSAGHFVKMVHNGIEYGDMQLIAEVYWLMKHGLELDAQELHDVFMSWNSGRLSSYLVEITADIFTVMDEDGLPLVDKILDQAGQKGTGRWTAVAGLELGVPIPTITAAVEARSLSAFKQERMQAGMILPEWGKGTDVPEDFIGLLEHALYAAKICSYAQGFALLRAADREMNYGLNMAAIARVWRAGCIIRAVFLNDVSAAFADNNALPNLLQGPFFATAIQESHEALRRVVATAAMNGIPVPALSASLAYLDGYRSADLPANLIQAQRDYFGAHTYLRKDREGVFHAQWVK